MKFEYIAFIVITLLIGCAYGYFLIQLRDVKKHLVKYYEAVKYYQDHTFDTLINEKDWCKNYNKLIAAEEQRDIWKTIAQDQLNPKYKGNTEFFIFGDAVYYVAGYDYFNSAVGEDKLVIECHPIKGFEFRGKKDDGC